MTWRPLARAIRPPAVLRFENNDGSVQTYHLVATRDAEPPAPEHWRKAIWRSSCRTCGAQYLVAAPATRRAITHRTHGLGIVNCIDHRRVTTHAAIATDRQLAAKFGDGR